MLLVINISFFNKLMTVLVGNLVLQKANTEYSCSLMDDLATVQNSNLAFYYRLLSKCNQYQNGESVMIRILSRFLLSME